MLILENLISKIKKNYVFNKDILKTYSVFVMLQNSVQSCHPIMHRKVVENVSQYLEQNRELKKFFDRLKAVGKKMFLVTNSPFHFV